MWLLNVETEQPPNELRQSLVSTHSRLKARTTYVNAVECQTST